ncbi:Stk1 family PASTA domain-containing Ser/Thr kinase [Arthrobacter zhaoguopingii]|uniref:Stk1 family PASTA domain-containing Ser/Thr kinase n=1 Tax=Arthrobacter zhaoguopingii TaxID=2681491 RepID=UPI00135757DB|nr:Stk1 family PASTA domain-containing Ser/Thr kinase [Arthrobacter zhaoguopingii]
MTAERVLNGRYEVLHLIGRGGMADVHLGRDIRLGRSVAIKVLRKDLARDPLFQSRFRREAQAVAGLNNPNIVAVYDTGEEEIPDRPDHEVRVPFIVMEYVEGRTLRDLVRSGELNEQDAVRYLAGVLSALEYSHRAGIVHRDIKPANVMVTPEGRVKVMDFGIARAIADSAATMTQTQAVVGTAQYLSPEQARGETVDARSDLYSAGCLLYELVAGRPPFVGDSPVSVAYQHVREEPKPASSFNPQVSPALDSVLAKALAKDREDRFQDAASFAAALEDARRGKVFSDTGSLPTQALATVEPATRMVPAAAVTFPTEADGSPATRTMEKVPSSGASSLAALTHREEDLLPAPREDYDDEGHRSSHRRAWIVVWVLAAVLVVLAAGYALLYSVGRSEPEAPPRIEVPAVASMTEADGVATLYEADLIPIVEERFHATTEAGLVIDSDPAAGAQVEAKSRVTISISKGPANIAVPEGLANLTESSAREALEAVGLKGGEITETPSPDVPQGRVVSTDPQAGQSVPAGSAVNLVLSNGRVGVPQLIGLTEAEAKAALADPAVKLPFRVEFAEDKDSEPGTVLEQSSPAASEVNQGTEIVLTVSRAPEPTEDPTPPPSAPETEPETEPRPPGGGKPSDKPSPKPDEP